MIHAYSAVWCILNILYVKCSTWYVYGMHMNREVNGVY